MRQSCDNGMPVVRQLYDIRVTGVLLYDNSQSGGKVMCPAGKTPFLLHVTLPASRVAVM